MILSEKTERNCMADVLKMADLLKGTNIILRIWIWIFDY